MNVAETIMDIRLFVGKAKAAGKSVGFVPTLGALHEGHFRLISAAKAACDLVVVSIFVNPTQFAPGEDLAKYPRTLNEDLAACERLGVDAVFAPSTGEMYGAGPLTQVHVSRITETLCGASRGGHFAGVCTVVAKLFNIVAPDKAFFGAKDFQQAVVIRRMVEDLNFPLEIIVCPTVREADGLAMSSRNRYLSPSQRSQAGALCGALRLAERMVRDDHPPPDVVIAAIRSHLASNAPDGAVDYIQILDPYELTDVETTDRPVLIALAVRIGQTRLIDNIVVDSNVPASLE